MTRLLKFVQTIHDCSPKFPNNFYILEDSSSHSCPLFSSHVVALLQQKAEHIFSLWLHILSFGDRKEVTPISTSSGIPHYYQLLLDFILTLSSILFLLLNSQALIYASLQSVELQISQSKELRFLSLKHFQQKIL